MEDEKVLAALQALAGEVRQARVEVKLLSANVDVLRGEVTRHGKVLITTGLVDPDGVPPVESLAVAPFPRLPLTTIDTIERPEVSQSIRTIDKRTRVGFFWNVVLAIATILTPIVVAYVEHDKPATPQVVYVPAPAPAAQH